MDPDAPGRWKSWLLVALSFVVSVAIAEVLVRLFVPVRDVGPLFTENDPLMGKRIKRNFRTVRVTPDFEMSFSSNSLGYRGPEPESPPANAVVFVGDSFTMGFGVSDGEEFPALIKAEFDRAFGRNAVAVVNTGMGNNGNGRWIKLLRSETDRFKPQLVVLQVMANDYDDNVSEGYFRVAGDGALVELPVQANSLKALEPMLDAIPGLSRSHLYALLRQAIAGRGRGAAGADVLPQATSQGPAYADRLTDRLISEAVAICQGKGYPVFAILVGLKDERLNRVQEIFRSSGIAFLAVPDKSERPDLYFRIDGHWNAAGHAYVARMVYERLRALQLVKAH